MFEDGGRVEIGVNAISTVICMLVKSLGTFSFPHALVLSYATYLSHHIFGFLSSSSNLSLHIPILIFFILRASCSHILSFYFVFFGGGL